MSKETMIPIEIKEAYNFYLLMQKEPIMDEMGGGSEKAKGAREIIHELCEVHNISLDIIFPKD